MNSDLKKYSALHLAALEVKLGPRIQKRPKPSKPAKPGASQPDQQPGPINHLVPPASAKKPGRPAGLKAKERARALGQGSGQPKTSTPNEVLPWELNTLSREEKVIRFCEWLPITKGILQGQNMVLLPEQREFIHEVFGTFREDGRRLRRIGIQSEPRGNGKTGFIAAIALAVLLGPESEPRGEVYSASIDREMASILFNEMVAIIFARPWLYRQVNIVRFHKRIEVIEGPAIGSIYAALSADARRGHGMAPTLWVYDEMAQVKDRTLLDNLMTAMGKRKEPLGLIISTQAPNDDHALSQLIDDGLLGVDPGLYVQLIAAPPDADPMDETVWKACNPAWGLFLDETDFRMQASRAKRTPAFLPAFRNLRLNQRVDAQEVERLVSASVWKIGAVPLRHYNQPTIVRVAGGLDLSGKHDLTAFVMAFEHDDGFVDLLPMFWTPLGQLDKRSPTEAGLFKQWISEGFLIGIPGDVIEYDFVARQLVSAWRQYSVQTVGYDRWRIDDMQKEIRDVEEETGMEVECVLEPFGQGFKDMSPAVDAFVELALAGRLRHNGHPVLNACVANAVMAKPDPAGNLKFDKGQAKLLSTVRIDGVVAATMAVGTLRRMAAGDAGPSIYTKRGLVELALQ